MQPVPLRCPVCGQPLHLEQKCAQCGAGHSFDRGANGYLNLLLPQKKHSANPGDDPQSLRARRAFLEAGHYRCLSDEINRTAVRLLRGQTEPLIADCCCGEGYYTRRLYDCLSKLGSAPRMVGFDISKHGVRMAACRTSPIQFVAASVFDIPLADRSVDLAVHAFAPFCDAEVSRVLRPGGWLLSVVPGRRHLYGLKQALYDTPYENDGQGVKTALRRVDQTKTAGLLTLTDRVEIARLFQMTPYSFRCGQEAARQLLARETLCTEIEFILDIYQK